MVDANAYGLTELRHDIFTDFAEAGDAHFLSRASLLNKAHHAAAKVAWASLSVPVPKNMQVQIARFLLEPTPANDCGVAPQADKGRVASLLQASGRSLKQLGVTQLCTECSESTPVPDWGQVCSTCFGNAEVARRKEMEEAPASLQPWADGAPWASATQAEKQRAWYGGSGNGSRERRRRRRIEKILMAWNTRTVDRLIMWECKACDSYSSNTDPELGAGHECMACLKVHHVRCKALCVECNACCCDCDEDDHNSDEFDYNSDMYDEEIHDPS